MFIGGDLRLLPEFLSFRGEVVIQQPQAQHYIDHHEYIYPGIAEEFAEINLTDIFRDGSFTVPGPVHLPETVNKKSHYHGDKEESQSPDYFFIDV